MTFVVKFYYKINIVKYEVHLFFHYSAAIYRL